MRTECLDPIADTGQKANGMLHIHKRFENIYTEEPDINA